MAEIDISKLTNLYIDELLETYPREDVKELMVRLGIARSLAEAESMINPVSDWIRVDEGDDPGEFDIETPS